MKSLEDFPSSSVIKNPPANAGDARDSDSICGSKKIPWRRKWQPIQIFLPGKSYAQRSLVGYGPWVTKSQT